jgi:hypothetical protein
VATLVSNLQPAHAVDAKLGIDDTLLFARRIVHVPSECHVVLTFSRIHLSSTLSSSAVYLIGGASAGKGPSRATHGAAKVLSKRGGVTFGHLAPVHWHPAHDLALFLVPR